MEWIGVGLCIGIGMILSFYLFAAIIAYWQFFLAVIAIIVALGIAAIDPELVAATCGLIVFFALLFIVGAWLNELRDKWLRKNPPAYIGYLLSNYCDGVKVIVSIIMAIMAIDLALNGPRR